MPDKREGRKTVPIGDFSGGERLDGDAVFELPVWRRLRNIYLDEEKFPKGRPHFLAQQSYSSMRGLAVSNNNTLLVGAGSTLFDAGSPIWGLTGTGRISYDTTRDRTIITAGGNPVVWDGNAGWTLGQPNTYALATAFGNKYMLCIVQSDNKRRFKLSAIGAVWDFGQPITGIDGQQDEYTQAIVMYRMPYDILDVVDYLGSFTFFTERAIIQFRANAGEEGVALRGLRIRDVEVWDVKVRKWNNVLFFMNSEGVFTMREAPEGIAIERVPLDGIRRTFLGEIENGEASINIDMTRNLLLVTPNSFDGITRVFHLNHKIWTHWNVAIKELVEIEGVQYATLYNDDNLYILDENVDTISNPYPIQIVSGLQTFGEQRLRKRPMIIGVEVETSPLTKFLFDVEMDTFPDYDSRFLVDTVSELENPIEIYLGEQGLRGVIMLLFENHGKFTLDDVYINLKLKRERLGFS